MYNGKNKQSIFKGSGIRLNDKNLPEKKIPPEVKAKIL